MADSPGLIAADDPSRVSRIGSHAWGCARSGQIIFSRASPLEPRFNWIQAILLTSPAYRRTPTSYG